MKDNNYDDDVLLPESSKLNKNSKNIIKHRYSDDDLLAPENLIEISPKGRNIVFILYLISNILISMDHGSIPASVNELRQLTSYDQSIGLFGSLVYFGNILGSMIFFSYINTFNRKTLLLISLFGNSVCLFICLYGVINLDYNLKEII